MPAQVLETDVRILQVLADYRILSAKRTAYILDRNVRALQRRLGILMKAELVAQSPLTALQMGPGRPENAYSLSNSGFSLLVERGVLDETPGPQWTTAAPILLQLHHQDMVNTARISLLQLDRGSDQLKAEGLSSNSPFAFDPKTSHSITRDFVSRGPAEQLRKKAFVPDFVFHIHDRVSNKSLLFFLEADTGSEHLKSSSSDASTISGKVACYQEYFRSRGYKRYETRWRQRFAGFRLLLLCANEARASAVSRIVRSARPSDFIWVASSKGLVSRGISGDIWHRGGREEEPAASILGRQAFPMPLTV